MRIIGYGEDGLTGWALIQRFDLVVDGLQAKCQESSDTDKWTVFVRPSVGRGIGGSFGEFDAIIVAGTNLYLVESKWEDRVTKGRGRGNLKIDKVQSKRHEIFEWILENWRTHPRSDGWLGFVENHGAAYSAKFPGRQLPQPDRRIADNLTWLLRHINVQSPKHGLLYFYRSETPPCTTTENKDIASSISFVCVLIRFQLIEPPSLFFEISP